MLRFKEAAHIEWFEINRFNSLVEAQKELQSSRHLVPSAHYEIVKVGNEFIVLRDSPVPYIRYEKAKIITTGPLSKIGDLFSFRVQDPDD